MGRREESEESAVRELGDAIGYGRMMQLAEKIWGETLVTKYQTTGGGAHSVGPCVAFLVPCPCASTKRSVACDWCAGSLRVTKRVHKAMMERDPSRRFK